MAMACESGVWWRQYSHYCYVLYMPLGNAQTEARLKGAGDFEKQIGDLTG